MENDVSNAVQFPATKIAVSLGSGAGASVTSKLIENTASFLPVDAVGWAAFAASLLACGYTLTIWTDWWWKKFWKPLLRRKGWVR